ncbi:MAG TPA: YjbQ family protein [Candidatus Dormibacteraeota bacterium]
MISEELEVDTSTACVVDLTSQLGAFCADKGDGLVNAFVPHATAALVVIEVGAGTDADLLAWLTRALPPEAPYRHRHGRPGHGADHLVPAALGSSVTAPVIAGRPQLGAWQSLALVDTNQDHGRRRVRLSFLKG